MGNFFFFFKQKTAYEIGTGDWSSDVCSSDLMIRGAVDSGQRVRWQRVAFAEHRPACFKSVKIDPDRKSVV